MALFRRPRLAAERRPPLAAEERILAWSDADDGLRWTVRYDAGVDPDDPAVVAATEQIVAAAQE